MRPELKQLILDARARLGEYVPSSSEAEESARQKAMENFQILLARKLGLSTSLELFLAGEYVWLEQAPAVRFEIDGHTFVLRGADQECRLSEERSGELVPLVSFQVSNPSFADRLLAAIGAELDPL
jgi:hypothetical protein